LLDPLEFDTGIDEDYRTYNEICKSDDWKAEKLRDIAQRRQQDWFAVWVGQMARIAKPSAPVIIESVALPYCDYLDDWGGVDQEWWKEAINKYNWGVDPESLEFGPDLLYDGRYHVFMKKKFGE
jgi:hypothetical protein